MKRVFLSQLSLMKQMSLHTHSQRTSGVTSIIFPFLGNSIRAFSSHASQRGNYSKLSDDDIKYFRSILPPSSVLTEPEDLRAHNTDWIKRWKGHSALCLKPKTSEQVASILKYCNEKRLGVVPQGGNTGLVGGSVPCFDEIVLSTANMKNIISFDSVSGILVCEAGCTLQYLDEYLRERGFIMPLDLGAKGSCHIGGNVSTNAGGLRIVRYGSLHGSVLGVEAVLANGDIMDMLSTLRKDNTGFDMKQLFIGSEGTLGIVTKVSILTPRMPNSVNVALLACSTFEKVQQVFSQAKTHLSDILSAVEFFDRGSLEVVMEQKPDVADPFDSPSQFYVLIETSGSDTEHDNQKLDRFVNAIQENIVDDGTIATDGKQRAFLWSLREDISYCLTKRGCVYKYDLSVPVPRMYQLVEVMTQRLAEKQCKVVGYGHLGDGNLHLNISTREYNDDFESAIEPFVYEWTAKQRGSVSAEHGLGAMKRDCIHYSQSQVTVNMMKKIKHLFDPNGILNPYKVLPDQSMPRYK